MTHELLGKHFPTENVSSTPRPLILRFLFAIHLFSLVISPLVFTLNVVITSHCSPFITLILSILLSDYHLKSFQLTPSATHF